MKKATKERLLKAMGAEIRCRREKRGLRQKDLAKALDTTVPAASLIESGQRDLRATDLVRVADLLGARVADLVSPLDHARTIAQPAGRA